MRAVLVSLGVSRSARASGFLALSRSLGSTSRVGIVRDIGSAMFMRTHKMVDLLISASTTSSTSA